MNAPKTRALDSPPSPLLCCFQLGKNVIEKWEQLRPDTIPCARRRNESAEPESASRPVSLATNGVRMGLPGGGVLSKGAVGTAQDAVLQGAFSNLGIYRSVTAANVLGLAKIGYDLATFGYGLYQCTNF